MAKTKEMFTYADVANRYGVTKMTVFRWVKGGLLEAYKIGGRVYISKASLKVFEQRKVV